MADVLVPVAAVFDFSLLVGIFMPWSSLLSSCLRRLSLAAGRVRLPSKEGPPGRLARGRAVPRE